jgi:hypothetical protein
MLFLHRSPSNFLIPWQHSSTLGLLQIRDFFDDDITGRAAPVPGRSGKRDRVQRDGNPEIFTLEIPARPEDESESRVFSIGVALDVAATP